MPKSSRLVQVICARSAYLHTGQRPYQAALEGLIHDRTRSRGRAVQYLLARMGASIHGNLDEVVLKIAGKKHWLWRAVDQDGIVLDVLVQSRRDKGAAKRLLRKLLKRQCRAPRVMITDKLASYGAAKREVMPGV